MRPELLSQAGEKGSSGKGGREEMHQSGQCSSYVLAPASAFQRCLWRKEAKPKRRKELADHTVEGERQKLQIKLN